MGWIAYYDNTLERVEENEQISRPMQDGEDGKLLLIAQEDYGHKVAVDLRNGVFIIDYENLTAENGALAIQGTKSFINICDETSIIGDLLAIERSEPDAEGWFSQALKRLEWRPIWFTRHINVPHGEFIVKCIGAQTTLPEELGGRNIKSYISLFQDGRIGTTDGNYKLLPKKKRGRPKKNQ